MTTLVLLHTGIEVGGTKESEYGYWLLEVRDAALAGGFPSNPPYSVRSAPNRTKVKILEKLFF